MAIPKKLLDLIKKQCTDIKYGDDKLDDYLVKIYDSHEAKEKIQANNTDLVKQRDDHKKKMAEIKASNGDLETQIKTLKESTTKLSDEQKALLNKGMSKEVEGIINTLTAKVSKSDETLKTLTEQLEHAAKQTKAAEIKVQRENLNASLRTALSTVKIDNAQKIKTALALIESDKMVEIKDDNSIIYSHQENGKPFTFDNENDLAKYIAENHQYLVSSSGRSGGDTRYKGTDDKITNPFADNNVTGLSRQQILSNANDQLKSLF